MNSHHQINEWEKTSKLKRVKVEQYKEDFLDIHYDNGLVLSPHTRIDNYIRIGMATQHGDVVTWDHPWKGPDLEEGITLFREFLKSQIDTDPDYADEAADLQEMVERLT